MELKLVHLPPKKWLLLLSLGLLASLLVLTLGAYLWLKTSVPYWHQTTTLKILTADVEIVRDAHGIPHIFAANFNDAYAALGYAHAQDRFFQMEMMRRAGQGRLSEALGGTTVQLDKFMRTLGIYTAARDSFYALSPAAQQALQAYAAGVNHYISTQRRPVELVALGIQPELWVPADSLVWSKLMALQLSGNMREEILAMQLLGKFSEAEVNQLLPAGNASGNISIAALPAPQLPATHYFTKLANALPAPLGPNTASNAWAISGRLTTTGAPLLANDPHLQLGAPIMWYLARLVTESGTVTGATIPGVPFVVIGHNDNLAWGFTTTGADTQDLFFEKLSADGQKYLTPNGAENFLLREETIKVKDAADIILTVRSTRHGPVISDIEPELTAITGDKIAAALQATLLRGDDTSAEAVMLLGQAQSAADVLTAASKLIAPVQNLMFAERHGSFGLVMAGRLPQRKAGNGRVPMPGADGKFDWIGMVPVQDMPRQINPPKGYAQNANNAMVGREYPYLITNRWDEGYRGVRLDSLLSAASKDFQPNQTPAMQAEIMLDVYSQPAAEILPQWLKLLGTQNEATAILATWDYTYSRTATAPLIFDEWVRQTAKLMLQEKMGAEVFMAYHPVRLSTLHALITASAKAQHDKTHTNWCAVGDIKTCGALLQASLAAAITTLENKYNQPVTNLNWGMAHIAPLTNQFWSRVPVLGNWLSLATATDGGFYTLNRGGNYKPDKTTPHAHTHGAGLRVIYNLAAPDQSQFIIATGQSGNPFSDYYGNLAPLWANGKFITLAGGLSDLKAQGYSLLLKAPNSAADK